MVAKSWVWISARRMSPSRSTVGSITTLSSLLEQYSRYVASGEINSTVTDPQAVIATIRATYGDRPGVTLDELDGLTVAGSAEAGPWWFNVRPSNTEPLLRLNAEGATAVLMASVRDEALAIIRGDHA